MDSSSSNKRNNTMSFVKSKDTKIELALRKELWSLGLRYRKNVKSVFGKPDIAFIGKKIAVFCDSEFWHGYNWEQDKGRIRNNQDYWFPKIKRNMERDKEVTEQLEKDGWIVLRFWGEEIMSDPKKCANTVLEAYRSRS